jgi:hypothetical protein
MTFKRVVQAVTPRNRLQAAAVGAVLVGSLTAGVSYAAIPDSSGIIHGCYNIKTGALKVIDSAVKAGCPKNTTSLNWNQTGPPGAPSYATTMTITASGQGTAALSIPLGSYIGEEWSDGADCVPTVTNGSILNEQDISGQRTALIQITSATGEVQWMCTGEGMVIAEARTVTTQ